MEGSLNKSEWNDFVSASKWGDILQFWQWGEVKALEGWKSGFLDSGNVRSMYLIKKVPALGNIMYIPHGPIFPSVEELRTGIEAWKKALVEKAASENCFVIEIDPKIGFVKTNVPGDIQDPSQKEKFDLVQKNIDGLSHFFDPEILKILETAGFKRTKRNMQPIYKLLYNLNLTDDELMGLMDKSTRYNIRYAAKKGVVVKEYLPDDEHIDEKLKQFYDLMKITQERTGGYPIRPYSSFVKLFEVFKGTDNLSFFEASFEGDVIVMNISQRTANWSSSFYAGSNRLHPNVKASYLLRWESIKRAKEFGSKVYDFWGIIPGAAQHKGYSDNKLGFGGSRIDHVGIMQLPLNSVKVRALNDIVPIRSKFAGILRKIK
jgi:lipid II:glycine glycyltransferase (peptidoglycan interpeptide bridge formation enzyme)